MQAKQIATADFLDILFEGKNKTYGAYELRKTYNRRLKLSLLLTGSLLTMGIAFIVWFGKQEVVRQPPITAAHQLIDYIIPPKPVEPVKPPEQRPPASRAASRAFNALRITPDEKVNKNNQPPAIDDLDKVNIGTITQTGTADNGFPPAPSGNGNGDGPSESDNNNSNVPGGNDFKPVEIESSYPGGPAAWRRFLIKTVHYPVVAQEGNIQGAVIVKFIVDPSGNVSQIEAISGPDALRAEAVRVIQRSGKWTPAIQNGLKVKSYKQQVIVFRLSEE